MAEALSASAPADWAYTAEGGANVVLSYAGPPSSLTGSAVRLAKRRHLHAHNSAPAGEVDVRFGHEVVARLLGAAQVVRMQLVPVERAFLVGIRDCLRKRASRPAERTAEDDVDIEARCVVLTDDLVHGQDTLAVEIKPKWGFLPSQTHLSAASRDIKARHCRFCMHSSLKAEQGGTQTTAHDARYCPLDLYSGDEARVGAAVEALWVGWLATGGKANNLRLFYNGQRLTPATSDLVRLSACLRISSADASHPDQRLICQKLKSHLVPALLASPLLPTLRSLQSSLDPLDIEGITALAPLPTAQPTLDDWCTWTSEWAISSAPPEARSTRDLVLAYLLSATFKDCSVFVRFDTKDGVKTTAIKSIDLDPKPITRMRKYHELDEEIVTAFAERLGRARRDGIRVAECVA